MVHVLTSDVLASQDRPTSSNEYVKVARKAEVVSYLRSNEALGLTSGKMTDEFTGEKVKTYCMNCRSDGMYVWGEPLAYYIENYDIALPVDFLNHICDRLGIEP